MRRPRATRAEVLAALQAMEGGESVRSVADRTSRPFASVWNWRSGRSHKTYLAEHLDGRPLAEVFPDLMVRHVLSDVDPFRQRATCSVHNKDVPIRQGKSLWECALDSYWSRDIPGGTEEVFYDLLEDQAGVCAICGGTNRIRRLSIDHCHTTGAIRGLLCIHCNTGLGLFRDRPDLLQKAIAYLHTSIAATAVV